MKNTKVKEPKNNNKQQLRPPFSFIDRDARGENEMWSYADVIGSEIKGALTCSRCFF